MRHASLRAGLALALVLLPAAPAAGQDGSRTITLSPSRAEGVISKGQRVGPFGIRNTTANDFTMRVFPVLLGQQRDGSFVVRTEGQDRRQAARYLSSDARRFPFPPAAFRQVLGTVRRVPRDGGLYAALLFQARPAPAKDGQPQITQVFQIAASLFLDPPPKRRRIEVAGEDVRAEQAGNGPITLLAPLRNRGNTRVRARGRVEARNAEGRRVFAAAVKPFDVIPGAVVDLPAPIAEKLPAGDYTLSADLRAGNKRVRSRGSMKLFGDGRLASRQATLEEFDPPTAHRGEDVEVKASFRNTGNVPYAPTAALEVRTESGGAVVRRVPLNVDEAKPGETGDMTAKLRLPGDSRSYELTVRLLSGDRELDTRTVSVTPTAKPGLGTRTKDWVTENALVLVGALLLIIVVGAALFIRQVRRA